MGEGGDVPLGMFLELLLIVPAPILPLELVAPPDLAGVQLVCVPVECHLVEHRRRHILVWQLLEYLLGSLTTTQSVSSGYLATSVLTWETLPDPVNTKVIGPIDFGIMSREIS